MSQGYLVMAQGEEYLEMAIALAKSITNSQTTVNKISVITDQKVPKGHPFDRVIKLKKDYSGDNKWKIHN